MGTLYGSQCLEASNSTDCLLRALLELQAAQSSEYNWDPITFGFTTVIGGVALMFAITAIFQAVLASGKGRRRCSKKVVGKWSKLCKTGVKTWDWSEMNFQPTAVTPVLRVGIFLELLDYQSSLPGPADKLRQGERESDDRSWTLSAASWLSFFERLGLNEYRVEGWRVNTRSVDANYLPDDLMAAPAYAQVGAVVVAAVMAGARKLDIGEQQYPNLFGPDFQVDFRQHPGLGVVGAYSEYKLGLPSIDLVARRRQFETSVATYGLGFVLSASNKMKMRPQQLIGVWYDYNQQLLSPRPPPSLDYFSLEMAAVSEDHFPLLVGLFARTPWHVPMVFPNATMRTACHHYLTAFALNSWYFTHAPFDRSWLPAKNVFDWLERHDVPNWEGFSWSDISERSTPHRHMMLDEFAEDWIPKYLNDFMKLSNWQPENALGSQNYPPTQADDKPYRGYHVILNMCLKLIQEPEKLEVWFFDRSPDVQDGFRDLILKQLKQVDGWLREKGYRSGLRRHPEVDIQACAVMLFNTTMVLLRTETMLNDESKRRGLPVELILPGSRPSGMAGMEPIRGRHGTTTAGKIHSATLQVCKYLIDTFPINPDSPLEDWIDAVRKETWAKHLLDVVRLEQGPRQMLLWDRLRVLLGYYEKDPSKWPSEAYDGTEKSFRDFEDVIVYRCLLMVLLFRTATDTSVILPLMKSGIWEKIVPMI